MAEEEAPAERCPHKRCATSVGFPPRLEAYARAGQPFVSACPVTSLWCSFTCAGPRKGQAMRMYSWATWEGVGEALAAPAWLAWEGDASAVALAYPDALVVCRTQPSLSAIATLPLQVSALNPKP